MPKDKESVSLEDLVYSSMVQVEAVTRLLVEKGIITPEELIDEVKAVHAEQHSTLTPHLLSYIPGDVIQE